MMFLLEPGAESVATAVVAKRLGLPGPKPIGPMLASVRKRAEQMGLPNPVLSELEDDETVRIVRADLHFRDAALRHLSGND